LLIRENDQGFYWTPGGGLEGTESFEQALERELSEELNSKIISAKPYMTILDKDANEEVRYFLVTIDLPTKLPDNTIVMWYSKSNYNANTPQISRRIYAKVYPKLLRENLV
jgi:ADP-ribose pyrophosphatase YjhB (NUDIX family)